MHQESAKEESAARKDKSSTYHRFLDEMGDTTFYGKGNIADYLCWSVQRVFERGETRHYDYLKDRIRLVVDLYDRTKYEGYKNYYDKKNPLTAENKISPHLT